MTKEDKQRLLDEAKAKYVCNFNGLPFETRKKLACPYNQLNEIKMAIRKGDNLNMAYLKKREKELEDWMLEWNREQNT